VTELEKSSSRLRVENRLVCSHIQAMANTNRPASRALRAAAPRKTTKPKTTARKAPAAPKTPAPPAAAYVSGYSVGDQISHPMFGDGTVTAIDQNKLTIEFPGNVTKQIIDGYVKHRRA
jgi:hypothetical protein